MTDTHEKLRAALASGDARDAVRHLFFEMEGFMSWTGADLILAAYAIGVAEERNAIWCLIRDRCVAHEGAERFKEATEGCFIRVEIEKRNVSPPASATEVCDE